MIHNGFVHSADRFAGRFAGRLLTDLLTDSMTYMHLHWFSITSQWFCATCWQICWQRCWQNCWQIWWFIWFWNGFLKWFCIICWQICWQTADRFADRCDNLYEFVMIVNGLLRCSMVLYTRLTDLLTDLLTDVMIYMNL